MRAALAAAGLDHMAWALVPDAEALRRFDRLDGLVANAGAGIGGMALATPDAQWADQVAVKLGGVLNPSDRPRRRWPAPTPAGWSWSTGSPRAGLSRAWRRWRRARSVRPAGGSEDLGG
jgi:NAD(P)-dependent dehydrogenase (short-subunit alcohol dehydrogenase family)